VNVDRGATTDAVAIFTVDGGKLHRRRTPGLGPGDVFHHGGSVTHQHGLGCKRPRSRLLMVSGGGWREGWQSGFWHVERRLYRASPAGPLEPAATARHLVRNFGAAVKKFPELGTAFRSCTVAKRS
jgi:hypothetical protein